MEESKIEKSKGDWTHDSLREYVERVFKEADRRYEQRFADQEKAVSAALAAAEKAVNTALISAKEAVIKAESASEKRFESVNEFRATLADQSATLISRIEVEGQFKSTNEKVDVVMSRMDRLEGRAGGSNATWAYAIAGVGLLGTIVGIIGGIIAIVILFSRNG